MRLPITDASAEYFYALSTIGTGIDQTSVCQHSHISMVSGYNQKGDDKFYIPWHAILNRMSSADS